MDDLKYLGTIIKREREKENLTIDEVAQLICSPRQLIRIEHNDSLPNVWTFVKICDRLNIDYSHVIMESKLLFITLNDFSTP
ncbi:helix-turn-helix domain-containing protein [Listeria innocua]|uniref:helix-turn-helix domain-containing protein n=1 Tax=Listeria innocua TaxID=1642 RepID=UPI0013883652|nr:helix-turn-helix transcriptional regulator [Listeria innocua]EDO1153305.1 helix-turn-helix domain-containing protein [Listeria innocua]EHF3642126.1 helix-turn-helix transcriptional regulator [Listeria innocua]EKE9636834.1 helix-turn-helix transcriptional regulator [Listeria innocua]EKE9671802.1 helix-turn-helix transcriptional regulator [Listeria innocua]MBM5717198.1 XRE family transcriptional regulator [Listeria innocua]